jgi:putative flippase GtrA
MYKLVSIQFAKYIFVGGINFVFGTLIYFLLLNVFQIHYLVSFSISWILGVLLTYIINFLWIFRPEEKISFRTRFIKYFVVYITSYIANILILKSLTDYTHQDPFLLQFGIIPIVMMINFLGMKFWSLNA